MAEEKIYAIVITRPALTRYQEVVLGYLAKYFTYERSLEIDSNILSSIHSLNKSPNRGSNERYLDKFIERFKFILHKESRNFEIKIIYYVDEANSKVFITDFFPTKMNPHKLKGII